MATASTKAGRNFQNVHYLFHRHLHQQHWDLTGCWGKNLDESDAASSLPKSTGELTDQEEMLELQFRVDVVDMLDGQGAMGVEEADMFTQQVLYRNRFVGKEIKT